MNRIILAAILVLCVSCGKASGKPAAAVVSPSASPRASASAEPSAEPSATPTALSSPGAKPSPIPTPKTSPTLLFAVLEAKGTANAWTYTTVAAGKVYFADNKGVIRSLAINGTVAVAATFPLTSTQQMLSFAVSPDGTKLLGTIFTLPANISACNGAWSGTFTFDAYSATSGGSSQLVYHDSWTKSQNVLALTGWDSIGPIGTYPTVWASQGGGPGSTLGTFVRIDPTTLKVVSTFGDPASCQVWDSVPSGAYVCMLAGKPTSTDPYGPNAQPVSIRQAGGSEEWHFTVTSVNGAWAPDLAPDEQHVVICCNFDTSSVWLVDRQGTQTLFKTGFYASGWLDATTVFGYSGQTESAPTGTLAYVALNSPGTYVSMGFSGRVVGTVRN